MKRVKTICRQIFAASVTALVCSPVFLAKAETSVSYPTSVAALGNKTILKDKSQSSYIVGPGDVLFIEMIDIPELSGFFKVGLDGSIYLPRLRAVKVDGLTINGLVQLLVSNYKRFVKDPEMYIFIAEYRPIRIYVGGEVNRPGYYTLKGNTLGSISADGGQINRTTTLGDINPQAMTGKDISDAVQTSISVFPTVFDAIRVGQGITPYSDLSKVQVTRKRPVEEGGGRKRTQVDFLTLITDGDESQNLRLFDGDYVEVKKSNVVLREQLLNASQTNLSPQFFRVFVSGRVESPGAITLPQGSSLNKALLAASPKLLRGKVEFVRFTKGGEVDRRLFTFKPSAAVSDYRNPLLMPGDIVRVKDSIFTSSMEIIKEVSSPFVGVYSLYQLIDKAF
ncbi:polysaccharide biosynthesis/export family protein [Prochlorococcus sp. MIT 1341]|uniref:polysaccharide biosynthesis/export family protein n=1 Tax=Prochlorococcus sp. MIT 1341 TaxID=3096221 RepID=UPI002A74E10C|nr:polysaccharide biosynthesis/export family protein [Prochlorococcus sp. MIT 1341]